MQLNKVNYKKGLKHYNTAKKPKKQFWLFKWLMYVVSKILVGKQCKIEKINMEGVKAPYFLISNHMSFIDFEINSLCTYPARVNNITTLESYYRRGFLMELNGSIGKRKFTTDPHLVKACETVLNEYKSVLCMYPEARFSPIGTLAIIPDTLARLVKRLGHDVVVLNHHGNYLHAPFWNWRKKRKVPMHTTMTKVLDKKDVEEKSVEEIHKILVDALDYDEYKYQKDNGIKITEPYRAEGINKVLYQCPKCKTEYEMTSSGATLRCNHCGKEWTLLENGEMSANDGNTEFPHIPDWFEWERANVRKEAEDGTYYFEDTVDVYSMPNTNHFIPLGEATLKHSYKDGFTIEGHYNGEDYKISRPVIGMNGVHIEYDYCYIRPDQCIQISTTDDTFICYPHKTDVVTKLSFATEELYRLKMLEKEQRKKSREKTDEQ